MHEFKLGGVAKVTYRDSEFVVDMPGTHVICAITQKPIALDLLRYWSVAKQEAYIDAEAALKAHLAQNAPAPKIEQGE